VAIFSEKLGLLFVSTKHSEKEESKKYQSNQKPDV